MFLQNITCYIFIVNSSFPFFRVFLSLSALLTIFRQKTMHFCHSILMKKKISGRICSTSADPDFRVRFFVSLCRSRSLLISATVIHVVPAGVLGLILTGIAAGVLRFVPAGIAAAVLSTVLGTVLAGVTAGILGAVLLRIHGIGCVAVSAVIHITVMISHNDSLLFGLVNLLRD